MVACNSIISRFRIASMEKRIDLILENLYSFERIIKGCEMSLSAKIYDEREYNRRKGLGDVGVRVIGGGINDPTSKTAINREDIRTAIRNGDWIAALRGADNFSEYRLEIETISQMWTAYYIVKGEVETLRDSEYKLLCMYLKYNDDKQKLADELGVSMEALRARVYRVKRSIKSSTLYSLASYKKCA